MLQSHFKIGTELSTIFLVSYKLSMLCFYSSWVISQAEQSWGEHQILTGFCTNTGT